MNPRLILYISGLLIYRLFRSFYPSSNFDQIEIQINGEFILNGESHQATEIDEVIRTFRKTIPPDQKPTTIIELSINRDIEMRIYQDVKNGLRKNGFLLIYFRDKPYWGFWN